MKAAYLTSGKTRVEISSKRSFFRSLLGSLASEIQGLQKHHEALNEDISHTQQLLRPVRMAAAAILPPELTIADMQIGRLQEKRNQLQRVSASLARRETLAAQIKKIQTEIDTLSGAVTPQFGGVDYQALGDRMSDGMNTYLNKLNKARQNAWGLGEVAFQIEERSFKIRVGKASWETKLGGTLTLYFLLAYQYALLNLMRFPESHFPGLLLIDFPAELEGTSVADKENFVIEPFIELLSQKELGTCQLVAAGRSFADLHGAERIELSHVWKA